jgi:hypothetical protein
MDWLRENWFFIMFLIFFIWMHLSGHGCGGHGHGGHKHGKGQGRDDHAEADRIDRQDRKGD